MTKLIALLPFIAGCGTIAHIIIPAVQLSHYAGTPRPWVYGGTYIDTALLSDTLSDGPNFLTLLALIDLPLCLILDTIFLPLALMAKYL